jgi:hypothetical protein
MMKIPQARANAADASFPTLVVAGKACFNMRRTHAKGGSNSTADGNFWEDDLVTVVVVVVAVVVDFISDDFLLETDATLLLSVSSGRTVSGCEVSMVIALRNISVSYLIIHLSFVVSRALFDYVRVNLIILKDA